MPSEYRVTFANIPYSTNYALEGYATWDPHRLPNSKKPSVSRHTTGEAFDIASEGILDITVWTQPRGRIDEIAAKYNLFRAYHNRYIAYADYTAPEYWHFEYIGFGR